jgi:hypothetical protein
MSPKATTKSPGRSPSGWVCQTCGVPRPVACPGLCECVRVCPPPLGFSSNAAASLHCTTPCRAVSQARMRSLFSASPCLRVLLLWSSCSLYVAFTLPVVFPWCCCGLCDPGTPLDCGPPRDPLAAVLRVLGPQCPACAPSEHRVASSPSPSWPAGEPTRARSCA